MYCSRTFKDAGEGPEALLQRKHAKEEYSNSSRDLFEFRTNLEAVCQEDENNR